MFVSRVVRGSLVCLSDAFQAPPSNSNPLVYTKSRASCVCGQRTHPPQPSMRIIPVLCTLGSNMCAARKATRWQTTHLRKAKTKCGYGAFWRTAQIQHIRGQRLHVGVQYAITSIPFIRPALLSTWMPHGICRMPHRICRLRGRKPQSPTEGRTQSQHPGELVQFVAL